MTLSIRTNVASLDAQRSLSATQSALDRSMARLSSGYRITKSGDDAAGLGISTKLEAQIRSYGQAARNASDGISVIQTTEAALGEDSNLLTRLRELAMQSASDGIGDVERAYIQGEADQLLSELDRISRVTRFNGTALLDGSSDVLQFQVGVHGTSDDVISFTTLNATIAGTATVGGSPGTPAVPGTPAIPDMGSVLGGAGAAYVASMNGALAPRDLSVARAAAAAAATAQSSANVGTEVSGLDHEEFLVGYYASGGAFVFAINNPPAGAATTGGVALVAAAANGGTGGSALGHTVLQAAFAAYAANLGGGGNLGTAFAAASAAALAPASALGLGGLELSSIRASAATAAEHAYAAAWYAAGGVGAPSAAAGAAATAGVAALSGTWATGSPAIPGTPGTPAVPGVTTSGLGIAGLDVATQASARAALATVDAALGAVSSARATLGATGNRLQSAIADVQSFSEALSAANGRIRDVDVAEETGSLARRSILQQAAVAVLAQANQSPQLALKLLG